MASHRLEDDMGYSPVNEVRRVREQESAEDLEQESVTCVALMPWSHPWVVNRQASKQTVSSPNPLNVPSGVAKLCAPEFHLVGARMREAYATRLGSAHLPRDARRKRVRRSRHLLFTTRRSRAVELPGSRGTGYT
ncbi:hypothetical protein CRG98_043961 [Punica granatum]|uniref:Uncharacterized protein n=1 Tax=Punica granatum TaxID=22663 RepID=A0A2I0HVC0_PUNGR|nr:hypothetical protein CRG98_043961 [Punica granatum]